MSRWIAWFGLLVACGSGTETFDPSGVYAGTLNLSAEGITQSFASQGIVRMSPGIVTWEVFPGCFWALQEVSRDDVREQANYALVNVASCVIVGDDGRTFSLELTSGSSVIDASRARLDMSGVFCEIPCNADNTFFSSLAFDGLFSGSLDTLEETP